MLTHTKILSSFLSLSLLPFLFLGYFNNLVWFPFLPSCLTWGWFPVSTSLFVSIFQNGLSNPRPLLPSQEFPFPLPLPRTPMWGPPRKEECCQPLRAQLVQWSSRPCNTRRSVPRTRKRAVKEERGGRLQAGPLWRGLKEQASSLQISSYFCPKTIRS